MSERKAVERVVARIYQHKLKTTGRLPTGKEVKQMERDAQESGNRVDRGKKR